MQLVVPRAFAIFLCWTFCFQNTHAFVSRSNSAPFGVMGVNRATLYITSSSTLLATDRDEALMSLQQTADSLLSTSTTATAPSNADYYNAVRAPLKFIGPYPCLGLKFPELATSSQRQRNVTGVSLDFVLDTAANTNTINGQVANALNLTVVGMALPGVGAGGAMQGGATFLLGNAELEGPNNNKAVDATSDAENDTHNDKEEKEDAFTFMTGLTASALPVASPAAAGLLSMAFFNCFQGGVEFDWGAATIVPEEDDKENKKEDVQTSNNNINKRPPSVTFHGENNVLIQNMIKDMTCVPITELPMTRLPTVNIKVNGVTMPALLDTGSPITVFNAQAARLAGIETKNSGSMMGNNKNPLAAFADRFKEAQAAAQAAARGDVLSLATSNATVQLWKSMDKVDIALVGTTTDTVVDFASSNVYVGDLPGLAALNGLGGDSSPPAAVLGMDVLRTRPKMLLRAQNQEVYF